jgi:hypothetical protein
MKAAFLSAILALSLAAAPAVSAPAGAERTVTRARIFLGDIADVPPELALVDLGKSPRAGSSRVITLDEIKRSCDASALVGLKLPKSIKVVRKAKKLEKSALAQIAEDALAGQRLPKGARFVSVTARAPATVADGYDATRVDVPRLPRKAGKLTTPATLRFLEDGEEVSSALVDLSVELPASAAIPDVKKGSRLSLVVVRGANEIRATAHQKPANLLGPRHGALRRRLRSDPHRRLRSQAARLQDGQVRPARQGGGAHQRLDLQRCHRRLPGRHARRPHGRHRPREDR